MRKIDMTHKQFITSIGIPLVIVCGITVFLLTLGQIKDETTNKSAKPTATATTTSTQSSASNPSLSNPTTSSSTATSSSDAGSSNKACQQLSLAAAKKLIGQSAQLQASDSRDTGDIQTVSCSYSSGNKTVGLVIHVSKTNLGRSNNSLAFGSEKPSDVTDVPNYGQSAYWVTARSELDVLSANNWYIITRGEGASLQNVQAVADALDPNL